MSNWCSSADYEPGSPSYVWFCTVSILLQLNFLIWWFLAYLLWLKPLHFINYRNMFLQVVSDTWFKYHNATLCSLHIAVADSHELIHAMKHLAAWLWNVERKQFQLGTMPTVNRSHFCQLRICLMPSQWSLNQQLATVFSSEAGS
jgi:hypothetical protein